MKGWGCLGERGVSYAAGPCRAKETAGIRLTAPGAAVKLLGGEDSRMYPVACECGQVHQVPATMAGSRFPCACGREVSVPSLGRLKASVGQSAVSAEVRIEQMLQRGMLPEETSCLVCRKPTKDVAHAWTVCERATVQQPGGWVTSLLSFVTILWGFIIFYKQLRETSEGRDLRFRLPLRVCRDCTDQLRDPRRLKETLLDVPVYSDLLQKYPDADVSLDAGLPGIDRRVNA